MLCLFSLLQVYSTVVVLMSAWFPFSRFVVSLCCCLGEFVKVSLFSVFWFACLSLNLIRIHTFGMLVV